MFCPKCGSPLNGASQCPSCGAAITLEAPPVKQKTKSKLLAAALMACVLGEIYLGNWKRFWLKIFLALPTFFIGSLIWTWIDAIRILTGSISCDAKGVPLV